MQFYNILIVEDDFVNAQFLTKAVTKLGYEVTARVRSAQEALEVVANEEIHVVFMDIDLQPDEPKEDENPDEAQEEYIDGIECARLINEQKRIPIIYTTAFADSNTIERATKTNIFGYLIKPFDYPDVEAVLNLTIRQNYTYINQGPREFILLDSNYRYSLKSKTLFKDEQSVKLTSRESEIFYCLAINVNEQVTNEYLMNVVWGKASIPTSTIRNTMKRLRAKVPDVGIETLSGIGYLLRGS